MIPLLFGLLSLVYTGAFISGGTGGGYGILSLDETVAEGPVVEALNRNGIGGVLTESSQWVFLDDFGTLERIPLPEFRNRIEAFDPRNDGYAERLYALFVREGRRFFYIPMPVSRGPFTYNAYRLLQRQVARSLGDTPYSLALPRPPRPVLWYLILFGCAALGTLIVSAFPSGKSGGAFLPALSLLPLLAPFALTGPAGFALSGALFGLFGVTLAPLREFFVSRRYRMQSFSSQTGGFLWGSCRAAWFPAAVFLLAYGLICFAGEIPVPIALAAPVSFFCVLCTSLRAEVNRGKIRNHVIFLPVDIREPPLCLSRFPRIVLPFALASLVALGSSLPVRGESPDVTDGGLNLLLPSAGDYYRHAAFQAFFSLRPLGAGPEGLLPGEGTGPNPYLHYTLGLDGLISGSLPVAEEYPETGDFPPFPLEDLTAFLGGLRAAPEGRFQDLAPVFIIFIPGLLSLFGSGRSYRKKDALLLYTDKQAAA
ncbi:MAG: hypothetical protein LBU21_07325 [Treponema sp.]|nr:hypothetical protein [Treponema sp.]